MRSASGSPGCFVLSPRKNRPRQQRNLSNPKPSDPLSESIRGPMAIILKSPVATGAPGIPPRWTRSAKDAVCTAYSSVSHLWFTTSVGVVNEIYFPTIDQPQVRDLQFLITDGETFFHEERRNLDSATEYLDATGLGVRIVSHSPDGRYHLFKEVITDPHLPTLLINTRLEGDPDRKSTRLKSSHLVISYA